MEKLQNRFVKFKAFTLAEVLITLVIIGVVAAMAVPTLITFFQDKSNEVAFKKMYSNLTNAIKEVTQENGGLAYNCYTIPNINYHYSECSLFWDKVLSKMKASKECHGGLANGCQPEYKITTDVLAKGGSSYGGCGGSMEDANTKSVYTLLDGSMIESYYDFIQKISLFVIDTNGFKKPNKWGYDVFILTLDTIPDNRNNVYISDRICWIYEKGGKRINEVLLGK